MSATISSFHSESYGNYFSQQSIVKHNQQEGLIKNKDDTIQPELSVFPQKELLESDQEEQSKVQQLKTRDLEVRTHEQAHLSAAGGLATSGASFSYTKGADGVSYAVGGEVSIDTSPVNGDPAATIRKADIIRRAALAPASPSSQDQMVASKAAAMAEKARSELMQKTPEIGDKMVANYLTDNRPNPDNDLRINFSV